MISAIIYGFHFVLAIAGVDKFCDYTRVNLCGDAKTADEASGIFDAALLCVTIFHITEWVRQTVIITTCLVGVNMVKIYNALSINVPFGFIVLAYAMITGLTADETCVTA